MTRRRAMLAALLVAGAGLALHAVRASREPDPPARPRNRTRAKIEVFDAPYSPPDEATRRRFDGGWTAETEAGTVRVVLLDGVGDLLRDTGSGQGEWEIELVEYWSDTSFEIYIGRGEESTLWFAGYDAAGDAIVLRGCAPDVNGLPKPPFRLQRDR